MAVRAGAASATDEVFLSDSSISLCLLVNRRAKSMRVIDFRSGPSPQKRAKVVEFARREGVERVYTLVERDECSTWARMGFAREGNIPFFYKRSDAHVLGASVSAADWDEADTEHSGTRPALGPDGSDLETERLYQAVRKRAKELDALPPLAARVAPVRESDLAKAVAAALGARKGLTGFERFGRDGSRMSWACTVRGSAALYASVEVQTCFDHGFFELLTAPSSERELALARASMTQILGELTGRGIVGCFSLSPVGDADLGALYVGQGFRKTAVLRRHLVVGGRRVDAFLWSRKLAEPTDT